MRPLKSQITRLGRTRQAVHIHPLRPGLAQHLGNGLGCGTGCQHVIDNGDVLARQLARDRKRLA